MSLYRVTHHVVFPLPRASKFAPTNATDKVDAQRQQSAAATAAELASAAHMIATATAGIDIATTWLNPEACRARLGGDDQADTGKGSARLQEAENRVAQRLVDLPQPYLHEKGLRRAS